MPAYPVRATGDLTLCEVAHAGGGSARLRSSLAAAELDDSLPFRFVPEYVASPASMEMLRRSIRSMDRRRALELNPIIRDLVTSVGDEADDVGLNPAEVEVTLAVLREALRKITVRSLLRHLPGGSRLSHNLDSTVGGGTVSQAIAHADAFRDKALRIVSIGSSSINGLHNETWRGISNLIRDVGRPPGVHDALMAVLHDDPTGTA